MQTIICDICRSPDVQNEKGEFIRLRLIAGNLITLEYDLCQTCSERVYEAVTTLSALPKPIKG
jgi:hypothetical protein